MGWCKALFCMYNITNLELDLHMLFDIRAKLTVSNGTQLVHYWPLAQMTSLRRLLVLPFPLARRISISWRGMALLLIFTWYICPSLTSYSSLLIFCCACMFGSWSIWLNYSFFLNLFFYLIPMNSNSHFLWVYYWFEIMIQIWSMKQDKYVHDLREHAKVLSTTACCYCQPLLPLHIGLLNLIWVLVTHINY